MSWELIGWAVAGLVVSIVLGVGRAISEEVRGRRALRDARAGRLVSLPMRVVASDGTPRWQRAVGREAGRAYRDGDELVVLRTGGAVRIPLRDLTSTLVRTSVDEQTESTREVFTLVDGAGRTHELQVPDYVSPALTAAAAAPARAATRLDRARSTVPWRLALVALVLAAPFAVHQAAWHTGHDVVAEVVEVNVELDSCTVGWREERRSHRATVDCYEPHPGVGEELRIRAMAAPLTGQAMDHEGSYDAGVVLLGGPVALVLLAVMVGTVLRVGGPAMHLRAPVGADLGPPAPPDPAHLPVRGLAREVARREGWADGPFGRGFTMSPLARLRIALVAWPLWAAAGALFVAWVLPDNTPEPWSWPLTGLAAVAVGYAVLATVQTVRLILEPARAQDSRTVDVLTVRSVTDDWAVLLFNPGAAVPGWLVPFPGPARPPLVAEALVLGDLEEGAAVHLVIEGATWEPSGPVTEIDDDLRAEILADLRERLEIPPDAPWWDWHAAAEKSE